MSPGRPPVRGPDPGPSGPESLAGRRAALGRADLIRWAACMDDTRLGRLARTLGYTEEERPDTGPKGGATATQTLETAPRDPPPGTAKTPRHHREYVLHQRRRLAPPPTDPESSRDPPPEPAVVRLGQPPPLVPWRRLWPFLRAALGQLAERRRVDLPRLAAVCARLRPLRRVPRLKGLRFAPAGRVLLDLHPRLYPFWDDFDALKEALMCLRGTAGLEVLRLDQGPDGPVQRWEAGAWGPPRPPPAPAAGTPVLILGDLGMLGTEEQRAAWVRFGRRSLGSGPPPVVLTPVPPRWWHPDLAGLYFPVVLDRSAPIPPRAGGPRPWPARAPDLERALPEDPGARLLLSLLAPCIAIRPALLRHLRHCLPADQADAGSEAAAWCHPAFAAGAFALLPGGPEALAEIRHAFPADTGEARLAWDLIRAQQAAGAPESDCTEERVLYAALHGRTDLQAEGFLRRISAALESTGRPDDDARLRTLRAWAKRWAGRLHPEVWRHSPASEVVWLKANPGAVQGRVPLPPGYDLPRAQAAAGVPADPRDWRLVQRGAALVVEPWPAPAADLACGSPLVERLRAERPVVQVGGAGAGASGTALPLETGALRPLGEGVLTLNTGAEALTIAPLDRPGWAHTMGRDRDGLFVGFDDGQGERWAWWYVPGGPDADEWLRHWPEGRPAPGFFMDEAQYRALRAGRLWPEALRGRIGGDEWGLRAELTIAGVVQGFRWVWPGRFLMGSPESEASRDEDETLHEVFLTRGFWLAETACTQALWQAVMGDNPSYKKGPQRPVETVSFEAVQRFFERVNAGSGALMMGEDGGPVPAALWRLRLPSEAEWEYACRAGTVTAYSFGDEFDSKLANDGSATVDVRSLPPNRWGFYEMHGNVYEWCQDWYGAYPPGPVVDPRGPASGERRVLRGGCWISDAVHLRCASRHRDVPGYRNPVTGFRLALGPELQPVGPGQPAGSGAGLPARGASRSERTARAVRPRGARQGKGS